MTDDERALLIGLAKVQLIIGVERMHGYQTCDRPSLEGFYELIRKFDPSFAVPALEEQKLAKPRDHRP